MVTRKSQSNARILLTSLPRSGSTWVFKALEQASGTLGVFEPDHLDDLGLGENGMHPYLGHDDYDIDYLRIYERAFSGKGSKNFSLSKSYLKQLTQNAKVSINPPKCVIIKSVYSVANTELLYQQFMPKVVVLLRNPYSVAHSIHRKWPDARLKSLLSQPKLVSEYLEPYVDLIERAKTPYEILATRIGAYHLISISEAKRNPSWQIFTHEELCEQPLEKFREMYEKLGLTWTLKASEWVSATNSPKVDDQVQHVNRISSMEIGKWRQLLSTDEIDQIRSFYEPFNTGYYEGL